jgi:hypothetical protein
MNKINKSLTDEIKSKYIFANFCTDVFGMDKYYCSCGNVISKAPDSEFEIEISYEDYIKMDFIDTSKITRRTKILCDKCNKDYTKAEVYSQIFNTDQKFLEKFLLVENSKYLALYKYRFIATEKNNKIQIENDYSSLSISKKNKESRIYFKNFDNSDFLPVDLGEIVNTVNLFFSKTEEVEITEDFIYVHEFIGKLGRYVSDVDNIDIANELLSEIKLSSGIDILKKIISSFFGIISYPNLSTLAMNKGPKFLFDLMSNCPLPTTKFMKESGATSPLKIFNFLINLKNKQLQEQLDQDDKNKLGYKFITESGQEFYIKYDIKRYDENVGNVSKTAAKVFVRDEINERHISPFIFNIIKDFNDYENLIKYIRFISYEDLIRLCMSYEKDFLIELYKIIEFREDVNYERIIQFSNLVKDFCKTIDANKEDRVVIEDISKYDFNIYDDCQRMLVELKWDFNKVFYKIKKHSKLLRFHDDLIKHRSYLNDQEVNEKYIDFSNKFKYLEEYKQGKIKVKVIDLPNKLVDKAKEMKNCAASYVRRVSTGEYVAFSVYDNNPERKSEEFYEYMMVLELGKYGLEFVGVKGPCNIYGPDRFKKDVIKFLEDNDIAYKEVPSIKLGVDNKK